MPGLRTWPRAHWKKLWKKKNSASAHHCLDFQCVLKGLFHFYLKIDLKKIFLWFFFPVKAEIPYFSDLTLWGPRGDLGKRYFTLKLLIFWKFSLWHLSQISKYSLPKSPRGHPNVRPELYGFSVFTGKKIIEKSFLDNFLSSLEVSLIWSGIQLMRSFDFELEIVSQIPDQTSEFHTIVKNYRKKISA